MSTRIYVGNLSYTLTEDQVRKHFEKHGPITSCEVMRERETNKSRGFGFIEFQNADAAAAAKAEDGATLMGRNIKVNEAKERSRGGGQRRQNNYGNYHQNSYGGNYGGGPDQGYGGNNYGNPSGGYQNYNNYGYGNQGNFSGGGYGDPYQQSYGNSSNGYPNEQQSYSNQRSWNSGGGFGGQNNGVPAQQQQRSEQPKFQPSYY